MKNFILAFMMTIGLSASYKVIGSSKEPAVVYSAIINNPTLLLFSIVGIYLFLNYKQQHTVRTNWLQKILSLFISYCTWSITIYQSGIGSINQIISHHIVGVFFSVLTISSYFILLDSIQGGLTFYFIEQKEFQFPENKVVKTFATRFSNNPFLVSFLIIFSVWLLVALSSFPSVFMGDSLDQVEQFLGIQTKTAAHPVLSTLFIGSFVKFGQIIGNPNLGLFLYTLIQLLVVAILVAYSINLSYQMTRKRKSLLLVTMIIAVLPSINGTVVLATKDIIFSGFFVLYIVTLSAYFLDQQLFFTKKLWLIHSVSILFMQLFRYNALHFIALSLIVFAISELVSRKKLIRKDSLILLTILTLFVGSGINQILVRSFAEEGFKSKRREMLSLPFQQTARYLNYHEDEVSTKDKEVINNVLKYDVIKKAYNPIRSDAVKRTHNEEATSQEMSDYFKLVISQTISHPLVTLESVTASHGNLFNVDKSLNEYYKNGVVLDGDNKEMMERYKNVGLSDSPIFLNLNKVRIFFYSLWDRLPILSQVNNYGVHLFILLSLFVLSIRRNRFKLAAMFIPLGAYTGTLIAGPITQGYLRYELPILLVVPILVVLFFSFSRQEAEQ